MIAARVPSEIGETRSRQVRGDISVVIPTIGREALDGCVQSILEGSALPGELIVIDQGSSPNVTDWLTRAESSGVRTQYVRSTQRGAAAARNRGIERVTTRFVAVTDDDCRVAADWLERMTARLLVHPDALITGRVQKGTASRNDGYAPSLITTEAETIYRRPLLRRDPLSSGNMGFTVAVVDRFGLMNEDPRLRFAEDAEWSYRALRAGVPIVYAPEVVVHHLAWRDLPSLAQAYASYAFSQGAFYGQYIRRRDWFVAARAARDLLCGPWWMMRGAISRNGELTLVGRAYVTRLGAGLIAGLRGGGSRPNDDPG
jgi:GT2 family glycosyltransferase